MPTTDTTIEDISLAEAFVAKANAHADVRFLCFIDDSGQQQEASYRDLDRAARQIALQLLTCGPPGDAVIIAFDSGLEFLAAFWGALYAGMLAVPIDPLGDDRERAQTERLAAVVRDSGATLGLASHASVELARTLPVRLHWIPLSWSETLALPDSPDAG